MKIRKTFMLLSLVLFASTTMFAQKEATKKTERTRVLELNKAMTSEQIDDYYKTFMKRKPTTISPENLPASEMTKSSQTKSELAVPDDMIFPIESDEVQAILIEWPYITVKKGTNDYAEAMFDGWGLENSFGGYKLVETTSTPDVAKSSNYAKLHGQLANAIQKHTQVWIDVWYDDDTTTIKQFMADRGTPLVNYRFFVHPGNAFWARDWGPVAFYYDDDDKIAFMDFEYYGGRPLDDQLPIQIANDLGWKCFTNTIEYEGGNILVDGLGSLFTTSAVYGNNEDTYGLYYLDQSGTTPQLRMQTKKALTKEQVNDSLKHLLNLDELTVVTALDYDGGTGHIDLYCDMWEETGFVMAKYPDALASWGDAKRVDSIHNLFTSMENFYGNKYESVRVPLPKKNNGSWYTSGGDYNRYTRCWANHTFVNDAIIQPVFYDSTKIGSQAGDIESNREALNVLRNAYPGYAFEEIDVRSFDGFGGAIHCITKQIPAENPVRIYHQPARFFNTTQNGSTYKIDVFSQNHSGINNVKIYYKLANENEWKVKEMTSLGDSKYTCDINLNADLNRDTLYYYIASTSNNGKSMLKPMTAHRGGFYTMPYGKEVTSYNKDYAYDSLPKPTYDYSNLSFDTTKITYGAPLDTSTVGIDYISQNEFENIGEVYPNPAKDNVSVKINNTKDLYYRIITVKGQIAQRGKIAKGTIEYQFDTRDLKAGNYWILFSDGNLSTSRKLVIIK